MLQANEKNFQKRRIGLEVLYGKKITALSKTSENQAIALYEYLKDTKKIEVQLDFYLNLCAVCQLHWKNGFFAKEKLLLIPKATEESTKKPKPAPFRVTIPRVVCPSCSQTLREDDLESNEVPTAYTFAEAWRILLCKTKSKVEPKSDVKVFVSSSHKLENPLCSFNNSTSSLNKRLKSGGGFDQFPPICTAAQRAYQNVDCQNCQSEQQQLETTEISRQGENSGTVTPTSENNSSSSAGDSLQSMVDQKGFLVCTQLVKTGGADLSGLKAGDIFTQFGNIYKENFEGLKSIANFVRCRANQSFQVVVLRRVGNKKKKRGATFEKVRLHLTPLYCQDAHDGGVLGAVMNVYPLPTSDVQTQE